jgi:glutamate N-acetyltransferase / amino-acid N-acetyltransferase
MAAVHSRIKRNPNNPDVALIVADHPVVAAGVYTKNLVVAAPVVYDRQLTPSDAIRVVVANSGCANACTGDEGDRNAAEMARLGAAAAGATPETALLLSTGIIGEQLPMEKIARGIAAAATALDNTPDALLQTARGIMTTDLVHKLASRQVTCGERSFQITGMAKGSGMIGPNMATMLAIILTDAPLTPDGAQRILSASCDRSYNCISVDGHTSTNDTALLLASGAAGGDALNKVEHEQFQAALDEVNVELARAIVDDGEGATHLITIETVGCRTETEARRIAKTVADSPLVKTAVAGCDPNWGRIVSAAGYSGIDFDAHGVELQLNGVLLYQQGQPVKFDAEAVSTSLKSERETHILLRFREGTAAARFWSCDLTAEYVRINADYHT